MFVVKWDRKEVLTDQLQAIEDHYQTVKRDRSDTFGLLDNPNFVYRESDDEYEDGREKYKNRFLIWKEYKHSSKADLGLILVHFSDRILNVKAESIGMMVHL